MEPLETAVFDLPNEEDYSIFGSTHACLTNCFTVVQVPESIE